MKSPCEEGGRVRGKRPTTLDMVILNSSGIPQMDKALEHYGRSTKEEEDKKVALILGQEHHAAGMAWHDMQHKARAHGWQLQGAQAQPGEGGTWKAGTCIAVKAQFGLGKAAQMPHDISPPESPGRLSVGWVDSVLRGGIVVVSLYIWHCEGLSDRNCQLLEAAGEAVCRHGAAWCIAGDFNMTCAQLQEGMASWLEKIGGSIKATEEPTCRSALGGRTIDYAKFDERISASALSIWVDHGIKTGPHGAVRIRMRSVGSRDIVYQLNKPKAFPNDKPIGCAREPKPPDEDIMGRVEGGGTKEVGAALEHLMQLAEEALCGICDAYKDSRPDGSYMGRGKPRYFWGPTVPAKGREVGRSDQITTGLKWLSSAMMDLAGIIALVKKGKSPTVGTLRMWTGLKNQMIKPKKVLQAAMQGADEVWAWRIAVTKGLLLDSFDAIDTLRSWAKEAAQEADRRGAIAGKEAADSFKAWVAKQNTEGAAGLHKLAKRGELPSQSPVIDAEGLKSLKQQDVVDAEKESWAEIWERFSGTAEAPSRKADLRNCPKLPAITPEMLVESGKLFKKQTGLGIDLMNPRWITWLSRGLLVGLCKVLMAIEELGHWPEQVEEVLIALLPKPDGGRRPVGLLPTIERLWEKVRRPVVQEWRQTVVRQYNWAMKGRSSADAVWKQAICAEAAVAKGKATASVLVDLVKAFEMIRLEIVWLMGIRLGFNPVILRLCLEAFAFARRLVIAGSYSGVVKTLSAILAGGSFATDAMYIVLIGPCDQLKHENPQADLCLFIDDLTIHEEDDTATLVANKIQRIVDRCIELLEQGLGAKVSRGKEWCLDDKAKTIAIGSSAKVNRKLAPKMRRLGIATKRTGRLLGVDYGSGNTVKRKVQAQRLKKAQGKKRMLRRFGREAASRILKTGIGPGIRYGAGVVGASDATVRAARRLSCTSMANMGGRSQFGRLQMAGFDVGGLMAIDPIVEWAKAIWDHLVDRDVMKVAWKAAMIKVGTSTNPFMVTAGPAGAMVASAQRIGWKSPSPSIMIDQGGNTLDLDLVCPIVIGQHAKEALLHKDAVESGMATRIGGPPDLVPLIDFTNAAKMRRSPVAGSLKALGEGGWWTQSRLYHEGVHGVGDPFCRACGPAASVEVRASFGPLEGSFPHRACACPSTRKLRQSSRHHSILDKASSLAHCDEPLFKHGVPILSMDLRVPEAVLRHAGGLELPADFSFTGDAFTDGALRGGGPMRARRSAWAAVLVDQSGLVIAGLYGPCSDAFPSSLRAELWAIWQALRLAIGPLRIWTDSQGAVDGKAKGKQWCCAAGRPVADLWRKIWAILEDIGPDEVVFHKVKGHATQADIDAGKSTPWERDCNDHADHFAKRGLEVAEHQLPSDRLREAYKDARRWYSWLAELCAHWPDDVQKRIPRPKAKAKAKSRGRGKGRGKGTSASGRAEEQVEQPPQPVDVSQQIEQLRLHQALPPSLFVDELGVTCLKCKKRPDGDLVSFASRKCLGSFKAPRAPEIGSGPTNVLGHELFTLGILTWCARCGSWESGKPRHLLKNCTNSITAPGPYGRLKQGKHPLSGVPLGSNVRM